MFTNSVAILRETRANLDTAYAAEHERVVSILEQGNGNNLLLGQLYDLYENEPDDRSLTGILSQDPSRYDGWNGWFAVRATQVSRRLRIFADSVFLAHDTTLQRELAAEAYVGFGKLLVDALNMYRQYDRSNDERSELVGAISELTFLASMCRDDNNYSAGVIATNNNDHIDRIDAFYLYQTANGSYRVAPLQIQTTADQRHGDTDADAIPVIAADFLSSEMEFFRMARLIQSDIDGSIIPSGEKEMQSRISKIRAHIVGTHIARIIDAQKRRPYMRHDVRSLNDIGIQ